METIQEEVNTDTAELGRLRLLAGVEEGKLSDRTKKVYSSVLYEFHVYILGVQEKEPGKYIGATIESEKPTPMGPYDGLKFYDRHAPVPDVLFLSFLEVKNTKRVLKKRKMDEYDSGILIKCYLKFCRVVGRVPLRVMGRVPRLDKT